MRVSSGERTLVEARATVAPADDVITGDYYARLAQLCVTRDPTDMRAHGAAPVSIVLDDSDVARLVECAIRHPSHLMRDVVVSTIWNHPETFRQLLEFGLNAPPAFAEIRDIVTEALARRAGTAAAPVPGGEQPLLPRMPLPAHLQDRQKR
ncbi:MAG: hypothetical protein JO001_01365 [Alphaproteobacteria bacterium]|nr:hypothetical protein [Alphaproteobacteria bacterium]